MPPARCNARWIGIILCRWGYMPEACPYKQVMHSRQVFLSAAGALDMVAKVVVELCRSVELLQSQMHAVAPVVVCVGRLVDLLVVRVLASVDSQS